MDAKTPQYEGCMKRSPTHTKGSPWVCRHCKRLSCGFCAHRFGANRSTFVLAFQGGTNEQARDFTCGSCNVKLQGNRHGGLSTSYKDDPALSLKLSKEKA